MRVGDSIAIHDTLRAALIRFAPHVKHEKEAFVLSPGVPSYEHMAYVFQVGQDIAVKYGPHVSATERKTLEYISESTSVPVPHVRGVHKGNDGNTYIVMDLISGTRLYDVWDSLAESQKDSIANQLGLYFSELHCIRGHYIGSVGNGPCKDVYFDDTPDRGPFATEDQMNTAIVQAVRDRAEYAETFVTATLPWLSRSHEIVFCHSNLNTTHVIVDSTCERVLAIVGWQRAGFFPEHWDFVNALTLTIAPFRSDWVLYVQRFLKPYYGDYPLWCQLRMTARWDRQLEGR